MATPKYIQMIWLLIVTVSGAVLHDRYGPKYEGIQFAADRKLSITVFSDLHFGERKLSHIVFV
jgi:hypothetical protein